ncbi:hypothetical protein NPIL_109341 [Nephila pilipes]|uniref:Uncharacterized protein n=1 Tax=Nephila pilipes TaxID=299642 RepID=A0A8X6QFZ1_NEPPI|nr:hypothetical protein NPIL_109341 [Nephila pilipes]
MRLLFVDGLSGPHGASPLSPCGASEKRSSSSAFRSCDGFFLVFPASACRRPELAVSCPVLLMNFFATTWTLCYFTCVPWTLLKLQISTWDLVVPEDYFIFCNSRTIFRLFYLVSYICITIC